MAGVADEDHLAAGGNVALALVVDLGDQRARRVQHMQAARTRFVLDAARDAVGAEDRDGAGGHFREVLDKTRPFGAQALDDVPIVDDLVADVDRRPEPLQRLFDDLDRTDDARAEPAGLREDHAHGRDRLVSRIGCQLSCQLNRQPR